MSQDSIKAVICPIDSWRLKSSIHKYKITKRIRSHSLALVRCSCSNPVLVAPLYKPRLIGSPSSTHTIMTIHPEWFLNKFNILSFSSDHVDHFSYILSNEH